MDKLTQGKIRFIQQQKPQLVSGNYEISINHEIRVTKNQQKPEDTLNVSKRFTVRGERFHLDEGDIHSTFPAANVQGDFSRCLPHIVLKKHTLPWERSSTDKNSDSTWLALLLFYQDEIDSINVNSVKLNDLNASSEWLDTAGGESGDDQCTIVEVPEELLAEIVPAEDDLDWLSHIRQVSNEKKEDNEQGGQSDFAVIMGNRLPQTGAQGKINTVHLVSLENFFNEPSHSRYQPLNGLVQLVTLKHWEFTSNEVVNSFTDVVGGLSVSVLKSGLKGDEPQMRQIIDRGYTLLRHQMRQGDRTLSLYRGPLVPLSVPTENNLPINCADEALRFYPDWGLFDVSYAAAWQLGRLLALQNRGFITALNQWKRQHRRNSLVERQKEKLQQLLGENTLPEEDDLEADEEVDHFSEVKSWLADLKTLSEVPLHYLVADFEQMLPDNSIRFFQLDLNWVQSLTDGALSLGKAVSADFKQHQEYQLDISKQADKSARLIRNNNLLESTDETEEKPLAAISGILIRSDIIVNWPGLEVEAFATGDSENRLTIIRMKRLAENILICLFEDNLTRVDIHPPLESLHCSIAAINQKVKVRNPENGSFGDEVKYATVNQPGNKKAGVIDVKALADDICKQFSDISQDSFTAAQFAVSLISDSKHASFLKNTEVDAG